MDQLPIGFMSSTHTWIRILVVLQNSVICIGVSFSELHCRSFVSAMGIHETYLLQLQDFATAGFCVLPRVILPK